MMRESQPAANAGSDAGTTARAVAAAIALHAHRPGALLPLLHEVQDRLGYIPDDSVAPIARALNLSRAEVHGVVTFYHHFRRRPPGRHIVQLCQAEACRSRGAEALLAHARQRLGCELHGRSADGLFSLEPVYCLGQCANAPSALIDGRLAARLTVQRFDELLAEASSPPQPVAGAPPAPTPGAGEAAVGLRASPGLHVQSPAHGAPAATAAQTGRIGGVSLSIPPAAPRHAGDDRRPPSDRSSAARAAITLYVPRDSTARAVGADEVAAAIAAQAAARGLAIDLVRNGSRGLFWLEPLVEVATAGGRVGYGPVSAADVPSLFESDFLAGGAHPRAIGHVDDLPWLRAQQRLVFARIGRTDPVSLADYEAHEGYVGLRRALSMTPEAIVAEVTDSGLRGRGGAAFPTGIKWQTAARAEGAPKYIVCNADEGDSGSFADRLLMESDPFALIEGMTIAGLAVGATQGYVYVRSEYPHAVAALESAIAAARGARLLGPDLLGSGRAFDIEVRVGAGSYVCGEETALLESLEGKRGIVRAKPPLPAIAGLFGRPTVVNNVVTLATVPVVLARGAAYHRDFGVGRSRGTLALQLAGNVKRGGLVEVAFGITLRELIETYGGGTASGRPVRAVQVGGPLGTYVPPQHWDTPLDYEAYAAIGHVVGHGSVVVHDDTVDMAKMARFAMEFCALESCGKCTPCRIGAVRGVEIIDRIIEGRDRPRQVALLRDLADTMVNASLCAMGGMTPYPVLSALNYYPQDFGVEHASDGTAPVA